MLDYTFLVDWLQVSSAFFPCFPSQNLIAHIKQLVEVNAAVGVPGTGKECAGWWMFPSIRFHTSDFVRSCIFLLPFLFPIFRLFLISLCYTLLTAFNRNLPCASLHSAPFPSLHPSSLLQIICWCKIGRTCGRYASWVHPAAIVFVLGSDVMTNMRGQKREMSKTNMCFREVQMVNRAAFLAIEDIWSVLVSHCWLFRKQANSCDGV